MSVLIVVIASIATTVVARPQYNYPPPQIQIPSRTYSQTSGGLGIKTETVNNYDTSVNTAATTGGGLLVQKHIYVHVAPPDEEEVQQQRTVSTASAKHYKIIFIKAPSAPPPSASSVSLQGQKEERTIVYVLVKQPEDAADISVPTAAPTQPSKPEVYFIKYKTRSQNAGGGEGAELRGLDGGASVSVGSSRSTIGAGNRPASVYGAPGQSGPY